MIRIWHKSAHSPPPQWDKRRKPGAPVHSHKRPGPPNDTPGARPPHRRRSVDMDRETKRAVEEFRRNEAGPIENNLIDELVAGDLSRKAFLQRGALFGLSAATVGSLLGYAGEAPAEAAGFRAG